MFAAVLLVVGSSPAGGARRRISDRRLQGVLIAFVPIACGIAILKYRLYDIDVVINRAVVFGSLAAFITLVYVGIVVGIGDAARGAATNAPGCRSRRRRWWRWRSSPCGAACSASRTGSCTGDGRRRTR